MATSTRNSLFRSEDMSLIQLYIPYEIAQATVAELGELGSVEFSDLNKDVNAFQRAFVNEIRRLDEMDRKIRFLTTQCEKVEVPVYPAPEHVSYARTRSHQEIDEMEARLGEHDARVRQMNSSQETLNKRFLELTELRYVLLETAAFFDDAHGRRRLSNSTGDVGGGGPPSASASHFAIAGGVAAAAPGSASMPLMDDREPLSDVEAAAGQAGARPGGLFAGGSNLGFVTGVISKARMAVFERVLWRALRGNLYMNYAEIDEPVRDPETDEMVQKAVFVVFAHGRELLAKVRKLSETMGATLYAVNEDTDKHRDAVRGVVARLDDLSSVLLNTERMRLAELQRLAESLAHWALVVKKEKAIYFTMNLFNYDVGRKCLIAEGWCPKRDIAAIQFSLRTVTERTASTIPALLNEVPTRRTPPTFHRTNRFTEGFQSIVDSYGMARYQEVNPGLFTIITFPFLFAVMFGDLGHGILVAMFATWMVLKERELASKKWGEMWETIFSGRYIILLMGLFSIFTGFMYNDIFSQVLTWFGGSRFEYQQYANGTAINFGTPTAPKYRLEYNATSPYPIGIDPAWHGSTNALIFTNSYKMKMSIIIGILHMTFGISLQYFNFRHFRQDFCVYTDLIPQLVFLESIFGYLVVMIIAKWWMDFDARGQSPPSLLNMLIGMFLAPGTVKPEDQMYSGQAFFQTVLLLMAVACIPIMLFAKPYVLKQQMKHTEGFRHLAQEQATTPAALQEAAAAGTEHEPAAETSGADEAHSPAGAVAAIHFDEDDGEHADGEHEEFSEILVHQIIHTIEFCLSGISNTASYLRLWALSLAHAQLSEVLWSMVLENVFELHGPLQFVFVFFGFGMWFISTVVILICMEGLSAFLHALRLHWVEFNNKFYQATGRKFHPFSFDKLLAGESGDE